MATKLVGIFIVLFSSALFASTEPISSLKKQALEYWTGEKYSLFTEACEKIEKTEKTFQVSFNVALGYFRLGRNQDALSKIEFLENHYVLNDAQKIKTKKLKDEIKNYINELAQIRGKYEGDITMSQKNKKLKSGCIDGNKNCLSLPKGQAAAEHLRSQDISPSKKLDGCVNRSKNCLGFQSEEEAREYLRARDISLGYVVPVEYSSIEPEGFP